VVALGINHIDTSDYYGPYVVNELIHDALFPYPDDLHIVTKVGSKRSDKGDWLPSFGEESLISQVKDNLDRLELSSMDVVNFRVMDDGGENFDIKEPLKVLAKLKDQGLIKHIGISNVTEELLNEALKVTPIVTIQNMYNVANRSDDKLIDRCEELGIVYVPFFPLGGFSKLQSDVLEDIAKELELTPQKLALAWLLQRSPSIALIPGTSSVSHLKENISAIDLTIPQQALDRLNKM
jgi:pyridoxine 4-dehydrogenase